jgi:hypothetical protein
MGVKIKDALVRTSLLLTDLLPISRTGDNTPQVVTGEALVFASVKTYTNLASFPLTGETSGIYIALDTNRLFRWNGSNYVSLKVDTEGWDGQVSTFADLPLAASHNGEVWLVTGETGTKIFSNKKYAGLYSSNGTVWSLMPMLEGAVITEEALTTNAIVRAASETTVKNSGVLIDNSNNITGVNNLTITSLTAGSIPFAGTGGLLSQDNSNLFWNNTSKRLGVGTNAPDYALDLRGNVAGNFGQVIRNANTTAAARAILIFQAFTNSVTFALDNTSLAMTEVGSSSITTRRFDYDTFFFRNNGGSQYASISSAGVNISSLTASQAVVTDASKNLISLAYTSAATPSTLVSRDSNGDSSLRTLTLTLNQVFSGSGARITGDFSNSTRSNRVNFQSSTVNGNTGVGAIPNGSANTGAFLAYGNDDPNNASYAQFHATDASHVGISSNATGTATIQPIDFQFSGVTAVRITTNGNLAPLNDVVIENTKAIKTNTTTGNTALFQAYDVDGGAYSTFATLTNGNTPSFAIASPAGGSVTINGAVIGGITPAAGTFTSITNTSLTAGSVMFAASGGLVSQNNTNLFWDNSNVRLNLGNPASPTARLNVSRTAFVYSAESGHFWHLRATNTNVNIGSGAGLSLEVANAPGGTGSFGYIWNSYHFGGFSRLNFVASSTAPSTTNTAQMCLTGDGRLGINTTNPLVRLEVAGAPAQNTVNVESIFSIARPVTGGVKWANMATFALGSFATTIESRSRLDLQLSNGATNSADVTPMTWLSNGNIGFSITDPHASIHLSTTAANRKIILWETGDNDHQYYGFGINTNVLRYQTDNTLSSHVFYAAASSSASNELFRISGTGNVVVGNAALATNATNGFLYVPTCAGIPTGVPTSFTGRAATVLDTTNNRIYFYNGAWRYATLT